MILAICDEFPLGARICFVVMNVYIYVYIRSIESGTGSIEMN